jgi:hypothetical protein
MIVSKNMLYIYIYIFFFFLETYLFITVYQKILLMVLSVEIGFRNVSLVETSVFANTHNNV